MSTKKMQIYRKEAKEILLASTKSRICFFCQNPVYIFAKVTGHGKTKWVIHHINGDISDNREENLAWSHRHCHSKDHSIKLFRSIWREFWIMTDRILLSRRYYFSRLTAEERRKLKVDYHRRYKRTNPKYFSIWRRWRFFWQLTAPEITPSWIRSPTWSLFCCPLYDAAGNRVYYSIHERARPKNAQKRHLTQAEKIIRKREANRAWKRNNPKIIAEQKKRAYGRKHPKKKIRL